METSRERNVGTKNILYAPRENMFFEPLILFFDFSFFFLSFALVLIYA